MRQTAFLRICTGIVMLLVISCCLSGCSDQLEGVLENQFTVPKKVTIEKHDTVTPTPEPTPTPTPEPTPSPEVQSVLDENAKTTALTPLEDPEAEGADGQPAATPTPEIEKPTVLPEGTISAVGVTKEESDAATLARQEKVVDAANDLLDHGYYSKESLITDLMNRGYTYEEATYGAENCYVDWGY